MANEGGDDAAPAKQIIRCQYPGCLADLTKLKRFNLRCKICEEHCKAESVVINGEAQRFCQQCNKFHPVNAFDGTKRGCRDKLEKHNKRRRNHRSKEGGDGKGDADGKRARGSRMKKGDAHDGVEGAATTEVDAFNGGVNAFPPFQSDFQQAAAAAGGANGGPPYAAGMQNYLAQLSQHAAAAWAAQASALNFPGGPTSSGVPGSGPPPAMIQPPTPQEQFVPKVESSGLPDGPGMPGQAPGGSGAALSPEQLQRYMLLASYANYMNGHP